MLIYTCVQCRFWFILLGSSTFHKYQSSGVIFIFTHSVQVVVRFKNSTINTVSKFTFRLIQQFVKMLCLYYKRLLEFLFKSNCLSTAVRLQSLKIESFHFRPDSHQPLQMHKYLLLASKTSSRYFRLRNPHNNKSTAFTSIPWVVTLSFQQKPLKLDQIIRALIN